MKVIIIILFKLVLLNTYSSRGNKILPITKCNSQHFVKEKLLQKQIIQPKNDFFCINNLSKVSIQISYDIENLEDKKVVKYKVLLSDSVKLEFKNYVLHPFTSAYFNNSFPISFVKLFILNNVFRL